MKTWRRAPAARRCGCCGDQIPTGAPLLEYHVGDHIRLPRCETCAGEPAPADLPLTIGTQKLPPLDMTRLGILPLDFKARAAREPGEEG